MKEITEEMKKALLAPIPAEAISQHPTKTFLSTIKAIYITERLNEVFGVGSWQIKTDFVERVEKMVVVKTTLTIPEYGIYYECFGGNDNVDLGDAYKGATTDAITKIGSYLGIAIDVFKGKQTNNSQQQPNQQKPSSNNNTNNGMFNNNTNNNTTTERIDFTDIDKCTTVEELNSWYNSVQGSIKTDKQREWIVGRCKKHKAKLLKQQQPIIANNPELEYK